MGLSTNRQLDLIPPPRTYEAVLQKNSTFVCSYLDRNFGINEEKEIREVSSLVEQLKASDYISLLIERASKEANKMADSFSKFCKVFTFSEIKDGLGNNSILLIDVRRSEERREPGRIPGSVNVPCT